MAKQTAVSLGDLFEALAELGVAGGGLGEGKLVGGGLVVFTEEGSVMSVSGGVDADADTDSQGRSVWTVR